MKKYIKTILWVFMVLFIGVSIFSQYQTQKKIASIESELHRVGASQTISSLTDYPTPLDADVLPITDTANVTTKKLSWANLKATMRSSNVLSPYFSTSTGLANLLSDETGSGSLVFGTSPTITSATMTTPYINVAGTEAKGDLLYLSDNGGTLSRLGIGVDGKFLTVTGGVPTWGDAITFPYVGSSTFMGTTSIAADSVTNRALILDGLAYQYPASRGASSTVLMEDGSGRLTWNTPSQCVYNGEGGTLSVTPGITYVNYPHNLGTSNYSIRAHWEGNEAVTTASVTWGEGYATSSTATSSAFAMSLPFTAAGIPNGLSGFGMASGRYLIDLQEDDKDKLYAWVNYVSATNTQLAWSIQNADTVNYRLIIEQCR